jgi:hypothetical protein
VVLLDKHCAGGRLIVKKVIFPFNFRLLLKNLFVIVFRRLILNRALYSKFEVLFPFKIWNTSGSYFARVSWKKELEEFEGFSYVRRHTTRRPH